MNTRSICAKFVLAILVVLAAHYLWAQDGIEGALSQANLASPLNLSNSFGRTLAGADFDNDHKLDGAVLLDSGRLHGQSTFYIIELHLSGGGNTELSFESAEIALAIEALDVNEDGTTDLVVERTLSHQRLYVWLNDGHGDFHRARIEDFQSRGNTAGGLDVSSSRTDWAAACLSPQRGTETARLAARSLSGLPPSSGEFKIFSRSPSPKSGPFSVDSSRAPPLSL